MNRVSASKLERLYRKDISTLSNHAALKHISLLIDAADDARSDAAANRATDLIDSFLGRKLTPAHAATAYYFRSNVWALRAALSGAGENWSWEQPEVQEQILNLRRARRHEGFLQLDKTRRCQILTNFANQLSFAGRMVDAISAWDDALSIIPRFAMALGNRGNGLLHYARMTYDPGHAYVFALFAHDAFDKAATIGLFENPLQERDLRPAFGRERDRIAQHLDIAAVRSKLNLDDYSTGRSRAERDYRHWCLKQKLFLNPLNDLGPHNIAAQDVLTLPSITTPIGQSSPPAIIGFFNQMKQEFVAARHLLYECYHSDTVHYADKGVLLYNTLDYPRYSYAAEKGRISFKISYSLLDKISYFLNAYMSLGHAPNLVSFRNVWYKNYKTRELHSELIGRDNPPLRGLFWLSKDIFEKGFKEVSDPDAEEINNIRNHLEHKYVQIHDATLWPFVSERDLDPLRYSISDTEFKAKCLHLLKLTRSALIYLSFAVHREELRRQLDDKTTVAIPMGTWDDKWRR